MSSRRFSLVFACQCLAVAVAAGAGMVAARPAAAQTAVNAEAGLDGLYKPNRWLPVRVNLLNQGASAKAEVRVRFSVPMDRGDEHRIPERTLPGSANEVHYLYMRSPISYGGQNVAVRLFKEGREVGQPTRPQVRIVTEGDWLVCGIGDGTFAATMKNLNGHTLPKLAQGTRQWMTGRNQATVNVGVLDPTKVPDRWQGLHAADMVVLGSVSDRELTPDQATAIRDYVNSGGTLVVTGGVDSARLTSPFFQDLLPVQPTGTRTLSALPDLGRKGKARTPSGAIPVVASAPKPGAVVSVSEEGVPIVVTGRKGAGRVVFLAFDPALSPFREWEGMRQVWSRILTQPAPPQMTSVISMTDSGEDWNRGMYGGERSNTLAQAPFSISQLDIPAFYVVALFLLAYIIVLVPVNYALLKKWDKKEYAWLTTPAIVLVFVVGAYMIGYGFKGGRTLLAKVGVVEAHANQPAASTVTYAGLFSPAKTTYDMQLESSGGSGKGDEAGTLLSEPSSDRESTGIRVEYGDTPRIEDMPIDMWAMRVVKGEGVVSLGGGESGFRVKMTRDNGGTWTGSVENKTRFTLKDCRILFGGTAKPVRDLPPGQSATFSGAITGAAGGLLPANLTANVAGTKEEARMKRAVLLPLSTTFNGGPSGWSPPDYPLLVGWIQEPVSPLQVNGGTPREQAASLMVVHLDSSTPVKSGLE